MFDVQVKYATVILKAVVQKSAAACGVQKQKCPNRPVI